MTNAEASIGEKTATVAEQGATVAPEKASSKRGASQKKSALPGHKPANGGQTKAAAPKKQAKVGKKAGKESAKPTLAKEASTPRAESKSTKILELIGRPKGATLTEIGKAVAWQAHSVRGFLSTTAKKQRIKIESAKNDASERTYRIVK